MSIIRSWLLNKVFYNSWPDYILALLYPCRNCLCEVWPCHAKLNHDILTEWLCTCTATLAIIPWLNFSFITLRRTRACSLYVTPLLFVSQSLVEAWLGLGRLCSNFFLFFVLLFFTFFFPFIQPIFLFNVPIFLNILSKIIFFLHN